MELIECWTPLECWFGICKNDQAGGFVFNLPHTSAQARHKQYTRFSYFNRFPAKSAKLIRENIFPTVSSRSLSNPSYLVTIGIHGPLPVCVLSLRLGGLGRQMTLLCLDLGKQSFPDRALNFSRRSSSFKESSPFFSPVVFEAS